MRRLLALLALRLGACTALSTPAVYESRRRALAGAAGAAIFAPLAARADVAAPAAPGRAAVSDELAVVFDGPLGLELQDNYIGLVRRPVVKRIGAGSAAATAGVALGSVIVQVGDVDVEEGMLGSKEVQRLLASAPRPLRVVVRDPAAFFDTLAATGSATSKLSPSDGESLFSIETLAAPTVACRTAAKRDDLLEVQYTARVQDGAVVDGSGKRRPGRDGEQTVYFVLGRQNQGQFPAAWNLGLEGACISERRRVTAPPSLAYGAKGLPSAGIPPDATVVYDMEVTSINGIAY